MFDVNMTPNLLQTEPDVCIYAGRDDTLRIGSANTWSVREFIDEFDVDFHGGCCRALGAR